MIKKDEWLAAPKRFEQIKAKFQSSYYTSKFVMDDIGWLLWAIQRMGDRLVHLEGIIEKYGLRVE